MEAVQSRMRPPLEDRSRGVWSEPILVTTRREHSGKATSHSTETKTRSRTLRIGSLWLFDHVYLAPTRVIRDAVVEHTHPREVHISRTLIVWGTEQVEIPGHNNRGITTLHLRLELRKEGLGPPMIRGAIDNNNLPLEVRPPMGERHAHKKFPTIHILYLKGILLGTKEDTP